MRKRTDGYVLVYVLIVIVIVSALVLSVCSMALQNLQSQEAAVRRTQQLYAAEGQVERFHAWLQVQSWGTDEKENEEEAEDAVWEAAVEAIQAWSTDPESVQIELPDPPSNPCTLTVIATSEDGTTVTAVMKVTFRIETEETAATPEEGGEPTEPTEPTEPDSDDEGETESGTKSYTCTLTVAEIEYTSFQISGAEGGSGS